MIPSGRTTIDRAGIAELHGMSWRKAERVRPWALPKHPKPVTPPNTRPVLWDHEQATAFSRGDSIPGLPTAPHPQDALHPTEAADLAQMNPDYWEQEVHRGRLPKPDIEVHPGVFFYSREVVEQVTAERQVPKTGGGRPPGATEKIKRAEIPQRVAELFDRAAANGEPEPSIAEVQRDLGVAYSTAHKHVHLLKAQRPATQRQRQRARDPAAGPRPE